MAEDVSVTIISGSGAVYVPEIVAVFAFEPATAVMGPTTQVSIWLSFPAAATGNGSVQVPLQVVAAAGTLGSEILIEVSATSPTFSIVN